MIVQYKDLNPAIRAKVQKLSAWLHEVPFAAAEIQQAGLSDDMKDETLQSLSCWGDCMADGLMHEVMIEAATIGAGHRSVTDALNFIFESVEIPEGPIRDRARESIESVLNDYLRSRVVLPR